MKTIHCTALHAQLHNVILYMYYNFFYYDIVHMCNSCVFLIFKILLQLQLVHVASSIIICMHGVNGHIYIYTLYTLDPHLSDHVCSSYIMCQINQVLDDINQVLDKSGYR